MTIIYETYSQTGEGISVPFNQKDGKGNEQADEHRRAVDGKGLIALEEGTGPAEAQPKVAGKEEIPDGKDDKPCHPAGNLLAPAKSGQDHPENGQVETGNEVPAEVERMVCGNLTAFTVWIYRALSDPDPSR